MTLVSSLRSRSTVYKGLKRDAATSLQALKRTDVGIEGSPLDPVQLATRSLGTHSRRTVILASVLGTLGFVALVVLIFFLVRYWMRRRALAEDMTIERPTDTFEDSQEKAVFQNPPLPSSPPKPYTPDRAYFPNHPYAAAYSRNSFPPAPPPKETTAERPQQPTLPRLDLPTISHPYTQTNPQRGREREPSTGPASTIYESFMSPDTPAPTPSPAMEPSPLASTAGGTMIHPPSQYETIPSASLSEETAPSSLSRSSSAPLRDKQPRHPYRR